MVEGAIMQPQLLEEPKAVYALNRRIQLQNRVPPGFPGFIRKGFDLLVVGDDYRTCMHTKMTGMLLNKSHLCCPATCAGSATILCCHRQKAYMRKSQCNMHRHCMTPSGLIYKDFQEGQGPMPMEGQEVLFHYNGYNESGAIIDSSYRKGRPAQTRLGVAGLIPGGCDI
eukprot:scaffold65504_cov17-Tisochrysis_lutea.AAC.2